jgi:hypothetical protein
VLLRVVLGEPGVLPEWRSIDMAISSELSRVEALRTIDRARIRLRLSDVERREGIFATLNGFHIAGLDAAVLERAANPFPTLVRTLGALQLATALLLRAEHAKASTEPGPGDKPLITTGPFRGPRTARRCLESSPGSGLPLRRLRGSSRPRPRKGLDRLRHVRIVESTGPALALRASTEQESAGSRLVRAGAERSAASDVHLLTRSGPVGTEHARD